MHSEGYSSWVCLSVCLLSQKTAVTYSAGNEGKKIGGIYLKPLCSGVMQQNMSEKANMLIISTYCGQLSLLDTVKYQRLPNDCQQHSAFPKTPCLLMPLAHARSDNTTYYSYVAICNARSGQFRAQTLT